MSEKKSSHGNRRTVRHHDLQVLLGIVANTWKAVLEGDARCGENISISDTGQFEDL